MGTVCGIGGMGLFQRNKASTANRDNQLLDALLGEPVAMEESQLRRVRLRSVARQRQDVLAFYPLRTWFDSTLTVVERGLGIGLLAFWAFWFANSWGSEALHTA